jgi:hypothetical protein
VVREAPPLSRNPLLLFIMPRGEGEILGKRQRITEDRIRAVLDEFNVAAGTVEGMGEPDPMGDGLDDPLEVIAVRPAGPRMLRRPESGG